MKIVAINTYGTLTFNQDGGAHLDGWDLALDDMPNPPPTADELGLLLYQFLAEETRMRMLARHAASFSTTVN